MTLRILVLVIGLSSRDCSPRTFGPAVGTALSVLLISPAVGYVLPLLLGMSPAVGIALLSLCSAE